MNNVATPASGGYVAEKPSRTVGEKLFDSLTYGAFNSVATFALSVGFTVLAKDGPWKKGWESIVDKATEIPGVQRNAANRVLFVTSLMMGGNMMVPVIKWAENNKQQLVEKLNRKFGSDDAVARGNANIAEQPKVSWSSLWKGRITAWTTVFALLSVVDMVAKDKKTAVEAKVGHWTEKKFNQLASVFDRTPSPQTAHYANSAGVASATDLVATIASSALFYVTSKLFSRNEANHRRVEPVAASLSGQLDGGSTNETTMPNLSDATRRLLSDYVPRSHTGREQHHRENTAQHGAVLGA